MDLERFLKQHDQAFRRLMDASTPATGMVARPLPDVSSRRIEIRVIRAGALSEIVGQPANGVVMRLDQGPHVIFVSDEPTPAPDWMPAFAGDWLRRYCVLHEYGHLKQGALLGNFRNAETAQPHEDAADRWAAHLLRLEAIEAGNVDLVEELGEYIQSSGFPDPVDPDAT